MSQPIRFPKPAQCESEVVRAPIAPCELLPHGMPGVLTINGQTYIVTILGHLPAEGTPILDGYRLVKADGTCHDICLVRGALECTCNDFVFRRAGRDPLSCKHCQAVRKHFAPPDERSKPAPVPCTVTFDDP